MVRQAHGQTFDEWQEAHDPTCLLIVELKPAPPFLVQSVHVEGLMQQLHTCMYTLHTHIYIYMDMYGNPFAGPAQSRIRLCDMLR